VDVFAGLSTEGYVLINTSKSFDELGLGDYLRTFHRERLLTCPATEIALEYLGRPLPNAVCSAVSPRSPDKSLSSQSRRPLVNDSRVPPEIQNVAAATAAYQLVAKAEEEFDRATTN